MVGISIEEEMEMKKLEEEAKREVQQHHVINLKKNEGDKTDKLR